MAKQAKRGYDTQDEIDFLQTLGTHSECKAPKRALLIEYRNAMKLRARWADINSDKVAAVADALIAVTP